MLKEEQNTYFHQTHCHVFHLACVACVFIEMAPRLSNLFSGVRNLKFNTFCISAVPSLKMSTFWPEIACESARAIAEGCW